MSTEQIKTHRYPGVKPFSENERHLFYGRSTDTKKLYQLINLEKLVLLYSKSGLGKSSLLNAGVLPLFDEQEGYTIVKIRLGAYYEQSLSPINTCLFKLPEAPQNPVLDKLGAGSDTLWLRLKALQHINADFPKTYILVFDQFEELFTYSEEDIKQFKKQLADLLYAKVPGYISKSITNRLRENPEFLSKEELEYLYRQPAVKVLISIRSDRMSLLNNLADYLPDIQKNYYELKPLDHASAVETIVKPALDTSDFYLSPCFEYSADCINKILDYLTQSGQKTIETFQLQTVCQYAENLSIENKLHYDEKKQMLLAEPDMLGDLQNIFRTQYDKLISNIEPAEKQLAARLLIENKLIIDGNRVSLPDVVVLKEKGINAALIAYLHDTHHLLRSEPNTTGGISYELSHDTLVAPILKAKKEREDKEELTRLEAERQEDLRKQKERIKKIRKRSFLAGVIVLIVLSLISGYAYTKNAEATRLKNIEYSQKLLIVSNKAANNLDFNSAAFISRAAYLFYRENGGSDFRNFYTDMFHKLQLLDEHNAVQDVDSGFIFSAANGNPVSTIEIINDFVYSGYFDGKILRTKLGDSNSRPETFFDFREYTNDTIEDPNVTSICTSADKNYLAVCGWFPFIKVFDLRRKTDESVTLKMPFENEIPKALFYTDAGDLLTLTDSAIIGWNAGDHYSALKWKEKKQFNYVDGKYLPFKPVSQNQQILWNANFLSVPGVKFNCMAEIKNMIAIGIDSGLILIKKDSLIKIKLPGIGESYSIKFDLSGSYIYIGSMEGKLSKVRLADFTVETNQNQAQRIFSIICSRDGKLLATASQDRSVQINDLNKQEDWQYTTPEILTLPDICSAPTYPVTMAFTSDNKYLLAGYHNGEIYKWPVSADIVADLICSKISPGTYTTWQQFVDTKNAPVELNKFSCNTFNKN
ncbi:MAG TPA: WD40 repeat domain-containing protein [Panacibacter sp.]|nr:WD40 repeat domain-containing protein [Panacibacter sp.]